MLFSKSRGRKEALVFLSIFIALTAAVSLAHAEFGGFQPPLQCTVGEAWCLRDAFNTGDNETIQICAATTTAIRDFNVWYNGAGPYNQSAGGISSATFKNGTVFTAANNITNVTGGGCVNLVINGTSFSNATVQVNATIGNNSNYLTAGVGNSTFFTINYVVVESKSAAGAKLGNVIFMSYNPSTKKFISQGPALTDASDGYFAEHCKGYVSGGNCYGVATAPNNTCQYHGAPFPDASGACSINGTANMTIFLFDFLSSNTTTQNVSANSTPVLPRVNDTKAVGFVMPFAFNPSPMGFSQITVTETNVTDETGTLIATSQASGQEGDKGGGVPFFISPNRIYTLKLNIQGISGTLSYPFMVPSSGMTGAQISIVNSSNTSIQTTTITGKVVNESGNAIPNVMVYAQMAKGGGGAFGINFVNSSATNANGIFTMKLPTTQFVQGFGPMPFPYPTYQFLLISNSTTGSISNYFPTTDTNGNRGYFVQGQNAFLPPLTIKAGGRADVNVTLNGASNIISELSKFVDLGTGPTRTDTSGKFTMLSIFQNIDPPSSLVISLLSPVSTRAVIDLFGKNQSFGGPGGEQINTVCFNSASITQGVATSVACNMTAPGYLNVSVTTCNDIFNCDQGSPEQTKSFNFWFETNGLIRDSTGNIVAYLSPDGTLLQELLGFGTSSSGMLSVPVPAGTYTLELVPGFEFSRTTGVDNRTSVTVAAGETKVFSFIRGNRWQIEPRFSNSLTLSSNNNLTFTVRSQSGQQLTNASVSVNAKVLYQNKTNATGNIIFTFDNSGNRSLFINSTFNPSSYGLTAGKYLLYVNVTNTTGNTTQSMTSTFPVNMYDFQVGLDMGGFSFGTGQTITAKLFAFNATGGVSNTSPVIVNMFDQAGNPVTTTISPSAVTNGEGTVTITMPSTMGFYSIAARVNASNSFGVSDNFVQVTSLQVKTTTDKQRYGQNDTVYLTVQVLNASSGAAINGASVQVLVDGGNTPANNVTGSDGKALIALSPSTFGTSSQWSFGFHNLNVKISHQTANDVLKLDTYYGFDVRGIDAFVQPDKPVYAPTDAVTLNVFAPSSVTAVSAQVDGNTTDIAGSSAGPGKWQIVLGTRSVGHHNVKVSLTSGSNTQTLFSGFDVNNKNILFSTDKFSYDLNTRITLTVTVLATNGTALNGTGVGATLFKAQSPNDINVTSNSSLTGTNGVATMTLNATKPGFNYIKIDVGGQAQFIGVMVSSVKVTLLSGPGGQVVTNYDGAPGSSITLYVNASNSTGSIADNSTVRARIWAFGNPIDLPSNSSMTNGNATITFQIPSNAPSQVYGLDVNVVTPAGEQGFAAPSTLTVKGGNALKLRVTADRSFQQPYLPGENATFTATISYANGTGASNTNVTFEIGSEATKPETKGTAVTDASGNAVLRTTAPSTDGPYFLHAYVTTSTDVQDYSGFVVSSLKIGVVTNKNVYQPGENVTLNVTITNRSSGSQVNATQGFAAIFNKQKGEVTTNFDPAGKGQPYQINVTIANDSSAVGTYPIGVVMYINQSRGFGSAVIEVRNTTVGSDPLNMTLPGTINATVAFLVNISSQINGTATLRIYSPSASAVVYENTSVALSTGGTPNASVNVTIALPGNYVFTTTVAGLGTVSKGAFVSPSSSGTRPTIWTGTSTSANATTFTTAQDVYVLTNMGNATSTIFTFDNSTNTTTTYSVPLSVTTGSNFYGIFNRTNLISGRKYFLRLDVQNATGLDKTMIRVT